MEHIAAIMMLVGCGYGSVDCKELPISTVGYETFEDCQEKLRPTVSEIETSSVMIYGKCTPVDPALSFEELDAAHISWTVTPRDELHVSIELKPKTSSVMIASAQ